MKEGRDEICRVITILTIRHTNGQRETYHSCEIKFLNNEYKARFFCKAIIKKKGRSQDE